ncbi:MAG TPA: FkbM family methyltransferase [Solirubrobacterales bacterium]
MASRRGIRAAVMDTGFAVADRLERVGLAPVTSRVRRLAARVIADTHEVDVDGLVVSGSLAAHGTYLHSLSGPVARSYELELFTAAVRPGATVLDCGAHLGLQTLVAARAAGPDGEVVAVEAAPATAAALRRSVGLNGFEDRVEVVEAAAASAPGPVRIFLHPWLDRAGVADAASEPERIVEVPGVRLDDALGDRRFDVAKIDVEGSEAEAVAGLERGLARSAGATVFLECHPKRLRALGVDPVAWLEGLAPGGRLELIDEGTRSLLPLPGRAEIERAVRERTENFNVRWMLAA